MYDAVLQSLPIALGIVFATLPALAIPLILITRRESRVLLAFTAGYAGGLIAVGGVGGAVRSSQRSRDCYWKEYNRCVRRMD
jgi:hypothetical protein